MWIRYNANPVANRIEDCAIRAVAVALNISWDDAFDLIAQSAKAMGAVMHLNRSNYFQEADKRMDRILDRIFLKTLYFD